MAVRILDFGSQAQYKGTTRHHVLSDPSVYGLSPRIAREARSTQHTSDDQVAWFSFGATELWNRFRIFKTLLGCSATLYTLYMFLVYRLYVCIVYAVVCVYTIHAHLNRFCFTCTSIYMYIYIYICMYILISLSIYIYIYTQLPVHWFTFVHAYIHTYIHAYMHTCIHAYMHTCIHAYIPT